MITIQELLFKRGLDKNAKIKLVRHKDQRFPKLYDWYRYDKEKFFTYQNGQSKDRFGAVDYIVSFIGEKSTLSRFIGVYKIEGKEVFEIPQQISFLNGVGCQYKMTEVEGFEDLKERVIVDWKNPISWYQKIENEMEVVEILPGLNYKQFKDFMEIRIGFEELKEIFEKEYKDWKIPLSNTNAIYVILDTKEGSQYIGSTYGEEGIWGRWKDYSKTGGHGNNKGLKELLKTNPDRANNFQWSILALLPKTITKQEAINAETLFKEKLGSRIFGLNNN